MDTDTTNFVIHGSNVTRKIICSNKGCENPATMEILICIEQGYKLFLPICRSCKCSHKNDFCHDCVSKLENDGLIQFYDVNEKIGRLATVRQSQATQFKITPTETSNLEEMFKDE